MSIQSNDAHFMG